MVAVLLIDDEILDDVIPQIIEIDPSNMDACLRDSRHIKNLYRQICNEQGKPLLAKFIKTFKGQIPDQQSKRILANAWIEIVKDQKIGACEAFPVIHYILSTIYSPLRNIRNMLSL